MAVCLIITTAGHQTGSDVPPSFALLFAGHTAGHAGIFRDWRRSQDTGSVVDRWGQKLVSQMGFLSLCVGGVRWGTIASLPKGEEERVAAGFDRSLDFIVIKRTSSSSLTCSLLLLYTCHEWRWKAAAALLLAAAAPTHLVTLSGNRRAVYIYDGWAAQKRKKKSFFLFFFDAHYKWWMIFLIFVVLAGGSSSFFIFSPFVYLTVRFFHTPSHSQSIRSIRTHKNNNKNWERNFFFFIIV